jgi:hypothetical protein
MNNGSFYGEQEQLHGTAFKDGRQKIWRYPEHFILLPKSRMIEAAFRWITKRVIAHEHQYGVGVI